MMNRTYPYTIENGSASGSRLQDGPGDSVTWPAGNIEFFLSARFASTKENGGKRPGLFDAAFLVNRYRTEFALLDLPAFVTAVVIPIVYRMGVIFGKYEKFKDAPAPMMQA